MRLDTHEQAKRDRRQSRRFTRQAKRIGFAHDRRDPQPSGFRPSPRVVAYLTGRG